MKLIRNGLVVVAVAASMVLPATAAHAASSTLKVTSFTGPGSQGWAIDDVDGTINDAYPYRFDPGPGKPPEGIGSLQFAPTASGIAAEKMFVKREVSIPAPDFRRMSFDYYFATDSVVKTPSTYYLNLYVDTAATGAKWYDCKFDYVASREANGVWRTLAVVETTAANTVTKENGATCGPSISQLQPTDKIFLIAVNAGDTVSTEAGLKGALDKFHLRSKGSDVIYDLEPAVVTPPAPVKACTQSLPSLDGTARNDIKNGTDAAQKINLLAGNDISDAKGGADCVIGGDGNDQLTGGAGNDEIQSGPGNDIVYVKNDGDDTVDCGGGNDIVFADSTDTVAGNCETVLPRR